MHHRNHATLIITNLLSSDSCCPPDGYPRPYTTVWWTARERRRVQTNEEIVNESSVDAASCSFVRVFTYPDGLHGYRPTTDPNSNRLENKERERERKRRKEKKKQWKAKKKRNKR